MNEKIETIKEILKGIENKKNSIELQTKHLKEFNRRMETLLCCFKAYSIEPNDTTKKEREISIKEPEEEKVKKIKAEEGINGMIKSVIREREEISLDELIKEIKGKASISSKYKIIEILNEMIKEREIVKKFEKKGFIYKINSF